MIRQSNTSLAQAARRALVRFVDDERGATAVEYALLASLIGIAIITATTGLGKKIGAVFQNVTDNLKVN